MSRAAYAGHLLAGHTARAVAAHTFPPSSRRDQRSRMRTSALVHDRADQAGQVGRREAKPEADVAAVVAPARVDARIDLRLGALKVACGIVSERGFGGQDPDGEQPGRRVEP